MLLKVALLRVVKFLSLLNQMEEKTKRDVDRQTGGDPPTDLVRGQGGPKGPLK